MLILVFDFCRIIKDVDLNLEEGKKEMKKLVEEKKDLVKNFDIFGLVML